MDEEWRPAECLYGVVVHYDDGFVVAFYDDWGLGKGFDAVVWV